MRLFTLPNGLLTDRERTALLSPPFDMKLEARILARGDVCTTPRIDGRVEVK